MASLSNCIQCSVDRQTLLEAMASRAESPCRPDLSPEHAQHRVAPQRSRFAPIGMICVVAVAEFAVQSLKARYLFQNCPLRQLRNPAHHELDFDSVKQEHWPLDFDSVKQEHSPEAYQKKNVGAWHLDCLDRWRSRTARCLRVSSERLATCAARKGLTMKLTCKDYATCAQLPMDGTMQAAYSLASRFPRKLCFLKTDDSPRGEGSRELGIEGGADGSADGAVEGTAE